MATVTENQVAAPKPEDLTVCARWASIAIREQLVEIQKGIKDLVIFCNQFLLAHIELTKCAA